mmetsp:Transcript_40829/g.105594  ORF Transcript_40829/g.105594 Transcript_40829/m.105594 type:complete len:280 (+) Transcript_40829:71-910(+)
MACRSPNPAAMCPSGRSRSLSPPSGRSFVACVHQCSCAPSTSSTPCPRSLGTLWRELGTPPACWYPCAALDHTLYFPFWNPGGASSICSTLLCRGSRCDGLAAWGMCSPPGSGCGTRSNWTMSSSGSTRALKARQRWCILTENNPSPTHRSSSWPFSSSYAGMMAAPVAVSRICLQSASTLAAWEDAPLLVLECPNRERAPEPCIALSAAAASLVVTTTCTSPVADLCTCTASFPGLDDRSVLNSILPPDQLRWSRLAATSFSPMSSRSDAAADCSCAS